MKNHNNKKSYLEYYHVLNNVFTIFVGVGLHQCIFSSTFTTFSLTYKLFGFVIHFCKCAWVDLMETYFKPLQTLFLIVAF